MKGIPVIGIHIHRLGEETYMDDEIDLFSGKRIDLEILEKLAEYKPLAKIEELEEQNYNMIDNVLNDGVEKLQSETERLVSVFYELL